MKTKAILHAKATKTHVFSGRNNQKQTATTGSSDEDPDSIRGCSIRSGSNRNGGSSKRKNSTVQSPITTHSQVVTTTCDHQTYQVKATCDQQKRPCLRTAKQLSASFKSSVTSNDDNVFTNNNVDAIERAVDENSRFIEAGNSINHNGKQVNGVRRCARKRSLQEGLKLIRYIRSKTFF